jgi:hypothetical protein
MTCNGLTDFGLTHEELKWFSCPKHGKIYGKPWRKFIPGTTPICCCGIDHQQQATIPQPTSKTVSYVVMSRGTANISNNNTNNNMQTQIINLIDPPTTSWLSPPNPSLYSQLLADEIFMYSTPTPPNDTDSETSVEEMGSRIPTSDDGWQIPPSNLLDQNVHIISPKLKSDVQPMIISGPKTKNQIAGPKLTTNDIEVQSVPGANGTTCSICLIDLAPIIKSNIRPEDKTVDCTELSRTVWYCFGCKQPFHLGCIGGTFTYKSVKLKRAKTITMRQFKCPFCRKNYAHAIVGRIEDNGRLKKKNGSGYTDKVIEDGTVTSYILDKAQIDFMLSKSQNHSEEIASMFNPVLSRGVFQ